jgi:hypothetical protein
VKNTGLGAHQPYFERPQVSAVIGCAAGIVINRSARSTNKKSRFSSDLCVQAN